MRIVLIDGMGGGIGRSLAEALVKSQIPAEIIAVGTNSNSTSNMMKAGITAGATGENPVIHMVSTADVIIGSICIVIANSMYGEISPAMSAAISASPAEKIFVPTQNCRVHVAGVENKPLSYYIEDAVEQCTRLVSKSLV